MQGTVVVISNFDKILSVSVIMGLMGFLFWMGFFMGRMFERKYGKKAVG